MFARVPLLLLIPTLLAGCLGLPLAQQETQTGWQQNPIDSGYAYSGKHLGTLEADEMVVVGESDDGSFVLSSDSTGNVQWSSHAKAKPFHLYRAHFTGLGGIIVAGDHTSEKTGVQQAYVMNLKRSGKMNWQIQYESKDDMSIYVVDEFSDRGLVFAGAIFPQGSAEKFDALGDSFVMKTSALGTMQWIKRFRLPHDDQVADIAVLPDDSVLVLINNFDENEQNLGMHLVRLNSEGRLIFSEKMRLANVIEGAALSVDAKRSRFWIVGRQSIQGRGEAEETVRSVAIELDFRARVLGYLYDHENLEAEAVDIVVDDRGDLHILDVGREQGFFATVDVVYRHLSREGKELGRETFGTEGFDIGHSIALLPDGRVVLLATYDSDDTSQLMIISETPK